MIKRTRITIIVIIALIVGGIVIMLTTHQPSKEAEGENNTTKVQKKPRTSTDIVDRDTGEQYDPKEPKLSTGWTDPNANSTQLFGLTEFAERLYKARPRIGNILSDTKSALYYYGDTILQRKYTTLTLIPSSVMISNSSIKVEVRLGQTDTKVPVDITIMAGADADTTQRAAVVIKQDSKIVLAFAGGLQNIDGKDFTIQQKDITSLSAEIRGQNTEAALQYIMSLGYTLSDLTITLPDHRSPFE